MKKIFLFVRIKSVQPGFSDWKQVGVFIKLSRLNNAMKSAKYMLDIVNLKSPRRNLIGDLRYSRSLLGNMLAGKGVIQADDKELRVGQDFDAALSFI